MLGQLCGFKEKNNILKNIVTNNVYGISLEHQSGDNLIELNVIQNNEIGVRLDR